ncbi:DNA ligase D [Caulobacter sp. 17J80-11]|uniref:DNA ligase D n=1 Tax=Caulobacter sp. 17J80-11 TaxID=2763502 RepID=UPI001653BEC8|nr:DNA ligase D [Caulobacter sp. 17J80-11]MBC6982982.1 DNA ligase D [Caulobacter sp. 17J80-11]
MADLETYRAKRDFSQTPEPSGERRVARSDRPRFVIQKHAATRLHYDLRLEHEGSFYSWAVTRGPSLDPDDKRLAVEVEPHPLDYGDFEGTIPKGQYGGGTVMLWDRGYFREEKGRAFEQGLKKGHLSLEFDGKRMQGGWSLIRIANDRSKSKRPNWLLIKHDDETARPGDHDAFLEENAFSVASRRTMEQIAAGKGRAPTPFMLKDAKTSAKAVWNSKGASPEESGEEVAQRAHAPRAKPQERPIKAKPAKGTKTARMPEHVEPQLCKLVDRPPSGPGWVHEIKFDGYRVQARVERGKATLWTRKPLDWTARFPEIARDCAALPDCYLDGEICALDKEGRPDFSGLQAALSSGQTGELVFFLFDATFAEGEDLRKRPLDARKARLEVLLEDAGASSRLRFVDHFDMGGEAVLKSACRMGLEGVVSKRRDAPYRSGRSDTWTKSKCRGGQEVVIGGWTTTGSKFRSLLAGMWRDGKLAYVGRVGTGFGGDKVKVLLPQLKAVAAKDSPFSGAGAPRGGADVHWVKPELVAEIAHAGWTGDGNVRQASFKGLREDKSAQEVVPETPEAREAVSHRPPARSSAGKQGAPVVLGVTLSNPDKLLWPDSDVGPAASKLDLARYYETVAEHLLPYVKGRPCSIIRTPDGITGERFFQRHAGAGQSKLVTLTTVSGDRQPYIQFDTAEALIAAAQIGATELHPWNCLPGKPEIPGRFVFDLDPDEDLPFERVIAAARELKGRLEALGLASFLKTTGGKGLHVVTPFMQPAKSPVAWPEAKAFAKALCERVAADDPDAYTTNMSKKVRGGRIFLDYLRNDRMATAVALLSPRARPGATVSFPLTWAQARKGLDPKKYTLHTAPGLLKRGDPWAGYEEAAAPLKPAIAKLAKS